MISETYKCRFFRDSAPQRKRPFGAVFRRRKAERTLPRHRDAPCLLRVAGGHRDATSSGSGDNIPSVTGGCPRFWISRNRNDVGTRQTTQIQAGSHTSYGGHRAGDSGITARRIRPEYAPRAIHARCRRGIIARGSLAGKIATVINGVLPDGIENGIHTIPSLRIARIPELFRRVDGDDDDCGEDGNNTDHEQELDESEALPGGCAGHAECWEEE